jgi:hypothetical protein
MGWLARKFIHNYDVNYICLENVVEFSTEEEILENEKEWLDRKMKDKLYPILDKLRYGYLKFEDINESNFKNFHGVFIQQEWEWFIKNFKKK